MTLNTHQSLGVGSKEIHFWQITNEMMQNYHYSKMTIFASFFSLFNRMAQHDELNDASDTEKLAY